MKSALEIAHEAKLRPINEIAEAAGILPEELEQYAQFRGKVSLSILGRLAKRPDAKLVIVTAITPTKAGEGKTTTSVALTQGLGKIGKKVVLCLREPSMGPVFGVKGGGTGGGYSQIGPMEDINLHFNGDFHAVTAAHNLLAAALDASIFNGNPLRIDPSTIMWPRTVDMNDRELRYSVVGLGGKAHGVPREHQFVITAASEVMAVFALANSLADLRRRLGRIVVASTLDGALVHAGPFGNIAHAANSILADRIALKLADYVITEAGFASDLGFQKFCDIVCRSGGFAPSAAVLVTTVRATKSHGGKPFNVLSTEDLDALGKGADNLAAHVQIVRQYGLPCVVAINSFPTDTARELALVRDLALKAGAETVVVHSGFSQGGAGATDLAKAVTDACDKPNNFAHLTPNGTPIVQQIEAIATKLYGAAAIDLESQARKDLERVEKLGLGHAPVCMAKTHLSLSHDPTLRNRPTGFILPVRAIVPSAGAEFVVALCGEMQRMPGLGKAPAFMNIDIDGEGRTVGLF
jgi:formate--tetrahydrofolate ligase